MVRVEQLIAQYDATLGPKSRRHHTTALAHEESYANFEARTAHATNAERTIVGIASTVDDARDDDEATRRRRAREGECRRDARSIEVACGVTCVVHRTRGTYCVRVEAYPWMEM